MVSDARWTSGVAGEARGYCLLGQASPPAKQDGARDEVKHVGSVQPAEQFFMGTIAESQRQSCVGRRYGWPEASPLQHLLGGLRPYLCQAFPTDELFERQQERYGRP